MSKSMVEGMTPEEIRKYLANVDHSRGVIGLCKKNITNAGAKVIAKYITESTIPQVIYLNDNLIGAEGAEHLIKALKISSLQITMYLNNNPIGVEAAEHFSALNYATRLTSGSQKIVFCSKQTMQVPEKTAEVVTANEQEEPFIATITENTDVPVIGDDVIESTDLVDGFVLV